MRFGKKFGFGGIARLNEGLLKSEYILGEHIRIHSNSVILSRTFHRESESINDLENAVDFSNEVRKTKQYIQTAMKWSAEEQESNRLMVQNTVNDIVKNITFCNK